MFRKMPVILLLLALFIMGLDSYLPLSAKALFYSLSISLKSLIVFVLPFLVFSLLFKSAVELSQRASKMVLVIVIAICVSNFISTLMSFGVGQIVYHLDLSLALPKEENTLFPLWELKLPKLLTNAQAMVAAVLLGLMLSRFKPKVAEQLIKRCDQLSAYLLKGLICIIPVFIAGFLVKLCHEKTIYFIAVEYAKIFAIIATSVLSYIFLLYALVNRFHLPSAFQNVKNLLPASFTGFGSMSSAAAMPLTILGVEKNMAGSTIARSIIPATVNIHLIGDCFAIPLFAFAVLKSFAVADPSFIQYLLFSFYFVLAKFSVAAVPGGGILVMLPVIEQYLGFNAEMLSLITALYILFDPVITFANVLGNGAFAALIDRFLKKEALSAKAQQTPTSK